ncbi:hypothetical protein [Nostoc sp. FACHB-892]|uniref:hypothetical protein n=1 Tax=Nostoc sp. FACHB-892 TaxID=2692843 RepID=UPI001F54BE44|nr:hypothetical protein [Nostoc sp. FACHB-892]
MAYLSTTKFKDIGKAIKIFDADQNFTISIRGLMLHLLLTSLGIIVYLAFARCLFSQWLFFLMDDKEMSPEKRFFSKIILVLITIFWPIIVPFAYLELLKFHRKYNKEIDLLRN